MPSLVLVTSSGFTWNTFPFSRVCEDESLLRSHSEELRQKPRAVEKTLQELKKQGRSNGLHKTRGETDEYTKSGKRIAVASQDQGGLEDVVSNVFARSPAFTIVGVEDGVTKRVTAERNKWAEAEHGAGPLACTHLIKLGVNVVIGPNFGPTVTKILKEAEIETISIAHQTKVRDAVQQYIAMQCLKSHRI